MFLVMSNIHGISLSGFIFAWGGTHATDIAHEIRAIKPVNRKWAHRAPDGDIQAQAPHAALLPSDVAARRQRESAWPR